MKQILITLIIIACGTFVFAQTGPPPVSGPMLNVVPFATGFDRIVDIENAGDSRLFVVDQDGIIFIVDTNGNVDPDPFLDIDGRVINSGNERGLLGLTFHPDYQGNGYFFVNYINNSGDTRISKFSVSSSNPDSADVNSEVILMTISQPYSNHNAGDLNFGPDGYLYVGTGDGGSGGDPGNRAQNPLNLLGKMLRIDVDTTTYSVPSDNPFVGDASTLDEIWAIGLRNPWRYSFDKLTGDLWIGDVGQNVVEEIDFQPANSTGGENYGWRCYEGNNNYNTSGCSSPSNYDFPVATFNQNPFGCSVTGGYVYRGQDNPSIYGHYLFTDYCSGYLWSTTYDSTNGFVTDTIFPYQLGFGFSTFGQDHRGELYMGNINNGIVYKIEELCSGFSVALTGIDESCDGGQDGSVDLTVTGGTSPYDYMWSNGSTTQDITGLSAGTYSVNVRDDEGCRESSDISISGGTPCFGDIPIGLRVYLEGPFNYNGASLHVVTSQNNFFDPANISINQGDIVKWMNLQGNHNVNGTQATYPSNPDYFGNAVSSSAWELFHTFQIEGLYDYQCDPHVGVGMVGTVTVNGYSRMKDDLRTGGYVPLTEPYSNLGFTHVNGGGGETIDISLLSDTGNNAIIDWVFVELRDGNDTTVVATRSGLLQRDGDVVDTDGISPLLFQGIDYASYFIVVRHRNHLGAMSANSIQMDSLLNQVDFTDTSFETYGLEAQKMMSGVNVLWAGNVNSDELIKYSGIDNDRDLILVAIGGSVPTNIINGYRSEDINMDGLVKYSGLGNDRDIILVNIGGVIPSAVRVEQLP